MLPARRARQLLRDGADPHASHRERGVTPAALAARLAGRGLAPEGSAAQLVLLAAEPWSPESHSLFPRRARERAFELARIGWLLSRLEAFEGQELAVVDAWRGFVMPHAVRRASH